LQKKIILGIHNLATFQNKNVFKVLIGFIIGNYAFV
jgi:hypothetical protein